MKEKMSRWGVGPSFAFLSIVYGMIMIAITRYFPSIFKIPFLPTWLLSFIGILLLLIGIPFFLISVKTVTKAYNSDTLVTQGIYRCCRHPLYSAWVVFIVPGFFFLVDSWIGLTTPFFMYFLLCKLVTKEEVYLEQVFGSEYIEYKKKVPCILPIGHLMQLFNKPNY